MGKFKFMCKTEFYSDGNEGYFWEIIEMNEDGYQETGDDIFIYKEQIINDNTESDLKDEAYDQTDNNQIHSDWEHFEEVFDNINDAKTAMNEKSEKFIKFLNERKAEKQSEESDEDNSNFDSYALEILVKWYCALEEITDDELMYVNMMKNVIAEKQIFQDSDEKNIEIFFRQFIGTTFNKEISKYREDFGQNDADVHMETEEEKESEQSNVNKPKPRVLYGGDVPENETKDQKDTNYNETKEQEDTNYYVKHNRLGIPAAFSLDPNKGHTVKKSNGETQVVEFGKVWEDEDGKKYITSNSADYGIYTSEIGYGIETSEDVYRRSKEYISWEFQERVKKSQYEENSGCVGVLAIFIIPLLLYRLILN